MAKKPNRLLRSRSDGYKRKKPNDRAGWEVSMLSELRGGQDESQPTTKRKTKGKRDNAKRLNSDFY